MYDNLDETPMVGPCQEQPSRLCAVARFACMVLQLHDMCYVILLYYKTGVVGSSMYGTIAASPP
jgi:hypothetical protein